MIIFNHERANSQNLNRYRSKSPLLMDKISTRALIFSINFGNFNHDFNDLFQVIFTTFYFSLPFYVND